jgi:exopolysaccharide production protein ExoQ
VRDAEQPETAAKRAGVATAANSDQEPTRSAFGIRSSSQLIAGQITPWFEASLDAATLMFFPLLVLVPRGVAALVSVAGLCGAGQVLSTRRNMLSPALGFTAALLGCLLLWGAVSALWSLDPIRSLLVAARLTGLFVAGLALVAAASSIAAPGRLTLLLVAGLVLGIVMALTELATGGALSSYFSERAYQAARLNQASIAFAVLVLPVGAMLVSFGYKICATLLAIATVGTIYALAGTAAKAALIAGLPMGLFLYRSGPVAARAAAVISIIIIVTAPLTFARLARLPALSESADSVKLSAGHRLLIWSFAGDRIAEQALGGWGLDSSRAIPGGEDPIRPGETWLPLHPHNAPLQLWLELGVPGAALFAFGVALVWRALAHAGWPPLFFAAAGGGLTIAFVGCFATYGIWQEWWLGTLWFSLFLVLVMARVVGRPARNADVPIRISRGSGPIT